MDSKVVLIALSCGPAQLLAPLILPVTLVGSVVQKIKALIAERQDKYLFHKHDPNENKQCIHSKNIVGNHGNFYKACPHDKVRFLHNSSKSLFSLFTLNAFCLIPVFGGLLADVCLINPAKT